MAYVLCLKEMHVISVTGHSLLLENKLAPQQVPEEVIPELLARGCVRCDEEGNVMVTGTALAVARRDQEVVLPHYLKDPAPVPYSTVAEDVKIDAAVRAVIDAKDASLLDRVHGFPKVAPVSERAGFRVTRMQIIGSCQRQGYC